MLGQICQLQYCAHVSILYKTAIAPTLPIEDLRKVLLRFPSAPARDWIPPEVPLILYIYYRKVKIPPANTVTGSKSRQLTVGIPFRNVVQNTTHRITRVAISNPSFQAQDSPKGPCAQINFGNLNLNSVLSVRDTNSHLWIANN